MMSDGVQRYCTACGGELHLLRYIREDGTEQCATCFAGEVSDAARPGDTEALAVAEKILAVLEEEDSNYAKGVGLSIAVGKFLLDLTGNKGVALLGLKAVADGAGAFIENKSNEPGVIQ